MSCCGVVLWWVLLGCVLLWCDVVMCYAVLYGRRNLTKNPSLKLSGIYVYINQHFKVCQNFKDVEKVRNVKYSLFDFVKNAKLYIFCFKTLNKSMKTYLTTLL